MKCKPSELIPISLYLLYRVIGVNPDAIPFSGVRTFDVEVAYQKYFFATAAKSIPLISSLLSFIDVYKFTNDTKPVFCLNLCYKATSCQDSWS